jgi:hypothetical protein
MYKLNDDQFQKLKEIFIHLNSLTLTGGQNFIQASNAIVKMQNIIEDLSKQDNINNINTKGG